jgi:hypothetical protein
MILILLTGAGFLLSGGSEPGIAKVGLIMALAGLKFGLVAWWFMELREATRLWSLGLLGLLVAILGMTVFLA